MMTGDIDFPISTLSGNWWTKKLAAEDEVEKRNLTFSFMVKSLHFSDSSGSNIAGEIAAFYKGLTRDLILFMTKFGDKRKT